MQKNIPATWDYIYQYTPAQELSWHEYLPVTSIRLINKLNLPKDAAIIDVGGGDSKLAKYLLALGYENITILDFSTEAIKRGKQQLAELATKVTWVHTDVLYFEKENHYDLWHDRATFNFLTDSTEQLTYVRNAYKSLKKNGHVIIGSFSTGSPAFYNDLAVQNHSEDSLDKMFGSLFKNEGCIHRKHITPSNELLPFVYCRFKKL